MLYKVCFLLYDTQEKTKVTIKKISDFHGDGQSTEDEQSSEINILYVL